MKIKAILFDADQTLFDFKKAEEIAFHETMQELGFLDDDEAYELYSKINDEMWKKLERKEIGKAELRHVRFRIYLEQTNQTGDEFKLSQRYTDLLSEQGIVYEGAIDVVKACSERVDCYLATNGIGYVQRNRFKKSGLIPYIKDLFISEELKAEKPSLNFFEPIFKQLSIVDPREVMMIGDSLSADIQGGLQAGCFTIWFNPNHVENSSNLVPNVEIDDLADILNYLD